MRAPSWGEPTGVSLMSALAACSDGARGINPCIYTAHSLGAFHKYQFCFISCDLRFRQLHFAGSRGTAQAPFWQLVDVKGANSLQ